MRTRLPLAAAVGLVAAALTALPTVAPTRALAATAKIRVVAMGDSYASGEGLGSYDAGTDVSGNRCHRSPGSWQRRLDDGSGRGVINEQNPRYDYHQVSCSHATVTNIDRAVTSPSGRGRYPVQAGEPAYQMDVLDGSERLVLLTVGGNDMGFTSVLTTCSLHLDAKCLAAVQQQAPAVGPVTDTVATIVRHVHARSPQATIVVAGYPYVIDTPSNPLGLCTGIDSTEARAIRDLTTTLDQAYAAKIGALRSEGLPVRYADATRKWVADGTRHDACVSHTAWINRLRWSTSSIVAPESYHPNAAGYRAYTDLVDATLRS